jgi:protein SCO1
MRKYRRLGALLVLVLCLMLGGWATPVAVTAHVGHEALPVSASSAKSIYQVESTWTTATAQSLRLGDLQGKVQVLAMVYTTCESACPIIVSLMQRLEAALPPELHSQVGFVLVTLEPERDTPSVLSAYSAKMRLDPASWSLLSGRPDDVMELRCSLASCTNETGAVVLSTRMCLRY